MAQAIYIGVGTSGAGGTDVNITADNITEMFSVVNGDYAFVGSGGTFTSNNKGIVKSTASTTLTALHNMDISFDYSYSSEAKYDKFTLEVAGNVIENEVSGATTSKSYTGTLTRGQTIAFTYVKDQSMNDNDDQCTFSNMVVSAEGLSGGGSTTTTGTARKVTAGYVGVDNKARKIVKAYIGVGGVARPCWSVEKGPTYYGKISSLNATTPLLAATSIENYALFGGGGSSDSIVASVNAYNKSLSKSTPANLSVPRGGLAAATVGNYALFGGGWTGVVSKVVDAYNQELTRSTPTTLGVARNELAAASVGDYALFGGGNNNGACYDVDAYNTSLTRSYPEALYSARRALTATSVGNYALFAGGSSGTSSVFSKTVDAYNASLTRTSASALSVARNNFAAAAVGNYAIFAGGQTASDSYSGAVDIYNASLTKTTASTDVAARLAAATVNGFAVFGGGYTSDGAKNTVFAYDEALTQTHPQELSVARYNLAAAAIGDYAIFAGGQTDTSLHSSVAEAYTA